MQKIEYLRVSTQQQGQSGLGLEGQQAALSRMPGDTVATFTEIESGSNSDRPELAKALQLAKQTGATLVVAKLDRLARNVLFISTLMESGVDFVACDMPSANRMTIQMMAVFAEEELRQISSRTKSGLAAAKERGTKLGAANPKYWETRKRNNFARKAAKAYKKFEYAPQLVAQIKNLRQLGQSLRAIADTVNAQGWTTARGGKFQPTTVNRLLGTV